MSYDVRTTWSNERLRVALYDAERRAEKAEARCKALERWNARFAALIRSLYIGEALKEEK